MGSFGFGEMLMVAVVAIIVFGKDLPQTARKAGRWYRDVRRKMDDLKDEVRRQIPDDDVLEDPLVTPPKPRVPFDPSPEPPKPQP